jgi:hypothetical protein
VVTQQLERIHKETRDQVLFHANITPKMLWGKFGLVSTDKDMKNGTPIFDFIVYMYILLKK